ncbi:NAD(P)H-dependent oxidoreductase [Palleronia marisminoris]|nr:NAD(P)H-dependent oxidoreductase [Palleronia marisminoris]
MRIQPFRAAHNLLQRCPACWFRRRARLATRGWEAGTAQRDGGDRGLHDGTPFGSNIDFASNYVRHMLGFFGIDDIKFVAADAMAFGAETAIAKGEAEVDALAA